MPIQIRRLGPGDTDFALSLTPRLSEFELPSWRDKDSMDQANYDLLIAELEQPSEGSAAFVAEDGSTPLGLLYLKSKPDAFSGRPWANVWLLVVAQDAEGRGIGGALLAKAEEWAREQGCDALKLQAFAGNGRARRLYEREGFSEDSITYVKPL